VKLFIDGNNGVEITTRNPGLSNLWSIHCITSCPQRSFAESHILNVLECKILKIFKAP